MAHIFDCLTIVKSPPPVRLAMAIFEEGSPIPPPLRDSPQLEIDSGTSGKQKEPLENREALFNS